MPSTLIDTYKQSTADDTNYEWEAEAWRKPVLPLDLRSLHKKYGYDILREHSFRQQLYPGDGKGGCRRGESRWWR